MRLLGPLGSLACAAPNEAGHFDHELWRGIWARAVADPELGEGLEIFLKNFPQRRL